MLRVALLAAAALVVVGCAGNKPGRPLSVTSYRCDNGAEMRIDWWPDKIDVAYADRAWTMLRVPSASGVRFSDGAHEVWEHQGVVSVTAAPGATTQCRLR